MSRRQIRKEYDAFRRSKRDDCEWIFKGNDDSKFHIHIHGPEDTPYAGGVFILHFKVGGNYPFRAPTVRMETKIFHININRKGQICLALFDTGWKFIPSYGADQPSSIMGIVDEVIDHLIDPMESDIINMDAAVLFVDDKEKYIQTAKEWTSQYAHPRQHSNSKKSKKSETSQNKLKSQRGIENEYNHSEMPDPNPQTPIDKSQPVSDKNVIGISRVLEKFNSIKNKRDSANSSANVSSQNLRQVNALSTVSDDSGLDFDLPTYTSGFSTTKSKNQKNNTNATKNGPSDAKETSVEMLSQLSFGADFVNFAEIGINIGDDIKTSQMKQEFANTMIIIGGSNVDEIKINLIECDIGDGDSGSARAEVKHDDDNKDGDFTDVSLADVGLKHGKHLLSFKLIDATYGKCIAMIDKEKCYNVYSLDKRKWIVKKLKSLKPSTNDARALVVLMSNDESLLMVSEGQDVDFYDLTNIGIPRLLGTYTLANGQNFLAHGFSIMSGPMTSSMTGPVSFEVVLYGGKDKDCTFRQSITKMKTKIACRELSDVNSTNFESIVEINETMVESNDTTMAQSNLNKGNCYDFGYESIINGHINERIIIVIGGKNNSYNVIMWNYTNDNFKFLTHILPCACDCYPATIVHDNHIHCLEKNLHFLLHIPSLIPNYTNTSQDLSTTTGKTDWKEEKEAKEEITSMNLLNGNINTDKLASAFDTLSQNSSKISELNVGFYINTPLICMIGIGEYKGNFEDLPSVKVDCINIISTFYSRWNYSAIFKNRHDKTTYLSKANEKNNGHEDENKHHNSSNSNGKLEQVVETGFKLSWTYDEIENFVEEVKWCLINNGHNGLIFVVSSHGGPENVIYTCDDCDFGSNDNEYQLGAIYNVFYPQQDKDDAPINPKEAILCQIPKIFIVDACRGMMRSKPVLNKKNNNEKTEKKANKEKKEEKVKTAGKENAQDKNKNSNLNSVVTGQNTVGKEATVENIANTDDHDAGTLIVEGRGNGGSAITVKKNTVKTKEEHLHKEANTCKIYANADGYMVHSGVEKGGMLIRSVNKVFKDVDFATSHTFDQIVLKISQLTREAATMVNNLFSETQLVVREGSFERELHFAVLNYNEPDLQQNQWQLRMNLYMEKQYFDKFYTKLFIENKSIDNDTISVWVEFENNNSNRDNLFESILSNKHLKEQFTIIKPNTSATFEKLSNIVYITAINESKNTLICDRFESTQERLYFFNDKLSPLFAKCDKNHNLLPKMIDPDQDEYGDIDHDKEKQKENLKEKENESKQKEEIIECSDCKRNIALDTNDVSIMENRYYYCYHCRNCYCISCCETRVIKANKMSLANAANVASTSRKISDPCVIMIGIGDYPASTGVFSSMYSILADYSNMLDLFGNKYGYSVLFRTTANETQYMSKLDVNNFQFKVQWSLSEIMAFIQESKEFISVNKHDSIIFVISSHGGDKDCIFLDSKNNLERVGLSLLWNQFYNVQSGCPYLADKPKLFIVNADQGSKESRIVKEKSSSEHGYVQQKGTNNNDNISKSSKKNNRDSNDSLMSKFDILAAIVDEKIQENEAQLQMEKKDNDNEKRVGIESNDHVNDKYLANENCCIIYANVNGYSMVDSGKNGSYLIRALRLVLADDICAQMNLDQIIGNVKMKTMELVRCNQHGNNNDWQQKQIVCCFNSIVGSVTFERKR